MEKPNKLDQAIKERMENFGDEPSAKVWMNIRAAVPAQSSQPKAIWYAAAAVILLLLMAGVWLINRDTGKEIQEGNFAEGKNPVYVQPNEESPEKVNPPIEKREEVREEKGVIDGKVPDIKKPGSQKQDTQKDIPSLNKENAPKTPAKVPANTKPAPKKRIPSGGDMMFPSIRLVKEENPKEIKNQMPLPEDEKPEGIDTPLEDEVPVLVEKDSSSKQELIPAPDQEPIVGPQPEEKELYASASSTIRGPKGAILSTITKGARNLLGMDASYDEKRTSEYTTTAFSADFGLFKIKRVKTLND